MAPRRARRSPAAQEDIDLMAMALGFALACARACHPPAPREPETIITDGKVDIAAVRRNLRLSQAGFAARYALPMKSLENWERGTRQPTGPARAYLAAIAFAPEAVAAAVEQARAAGALSPFQASGESPH